MVSEGSSLPVLGGLSSGAERRGDPILDPVSKRATASSGRAPASSPLSPDSCDAARKSVQETTIWPPGLAPFVCTSTPDNTHIPDHAGYGVAVAGFAPCLERNPPRW